MKILEAKNIVLRKIKQNWMDSTPNGNNRKRIMNLKTDQQTFFFYMKKKENIVEKYVQSLRELWYNIMQLYICISKLPEIEKEMIAIEKIKKN